MANPALLAGLGIGASALGTFFDIKSIRQQGSDAEAIARYNARLAEAQGEESVRRRIEEGRMLRRSFKERRATLVAGGAPLALLEELATLHALDQAELGNMAAGERQSAENAATLNLLRAKSIRRTTKARVRSSLIGGLTSTASMGFGAFQNLPGGR